MIDVVLFDLYETLITESGLLPTRASSLANSLGLEERAYRAEWKKRRPWITRGQISFGEALTDIGRTLGVAVDAERVSNICDQRRREKAIVYSRISSNITSLVRSLLERGVRLAVVSNGFSEDIAGWSKCSLAPHFQCTAFSCVEHVAKPDPEIYLRALQRLGTTPATAAFVGDGGDDELRGAAQLGLKAGCAEWFVRNPPVSGTWPALTNSEDVLKFVAGG